MLRIGLIYMVMINMVTFALYGMDKRRAVKNKWRISERALLGAAFFGGSLGAVLGMHMFRHKTKHWRFKILVPLFLLLHIVLLYFGCAEFLFP